MKVALIVLGVIVVAAIVFSVWCRIASRRWRKWFDSLPPDQQRKGRSDCIRRISSRFGIETFFSFGKPGALALLVTSVYSALLGGVINSIKEIVMGSKKSKQYIVMDAETTGVALITAAMLLCGGVH